MMIYLALLAYACAVFLNEYPSIVPSNVDFHSVGERISLKFFIVMYDDIDQNLMYQVELC